MAIKLLGKTAPRLWTPPLRTLTRRTSLGYDLADFAAAIGVPFLPYQRWLAIHALELNRDGTPRFRQVLTVVGRQCGKTEISLILTLLYGYVRPPGSISASQEYGGDRGRHAGPGLRDLP